MPWHDPALELLIEEQRRVVAALPPGPPPPAPPGALLPATEESLPGRAGLQIRVLDPGQARGVLLHFHAGGLTMGTPAMADASNSRLARACGIATVSLDYRLAPQHPHPAAVDDCEAAALWLLEHAAARFGSDRLLIGGDSAGAWLAAQTLLRLRDRHAAAGRFRAAYFAVGCFDMSMTPSQRWSTPAMFLSPERLKGTRTAAFPGLDGELLRDASISPLYAQLGGLPPAIFSVGTDDAVLDDSLFMAARWQAAGNDAELQVYPEGTHLFMNLPTRMAAEAWRRVAAFFDRHLSP
ncbi:MAG: alpha/beta hydrolase [Gammaproteobacteria bacterium]|nr:alpha/beta hydrolase [Gammaproteobacteria bacterium]